MSQHFFSRQKFLAHMTIAAPGSVQRLSATSSTARGVAVSDQNTATPKNSCAHLHPEKWRTNNKHIITSSPNCMRHHATIPRSMVLQQSEALGIPGTRMRASTPRRTQRTALQMEAQCVKDDSITTSHYSPLKKS